MFQVFLLFFVWAIVLSSPIPFKDRPVVRLQQSTGGCNTDVLHCPSGAYVARDPTNNCQFSTCPTARVCTMDVQACPGGSFVGRDGTNNCQFFPCPGVTGGDVDPCSNCPMHSRCPSGGNACVRLSQLNETCNPSLGPNINGSNCEAPLVCNVVSEVLGASGVCEAPNACTDDAKVCPDGSSVGRDINNNCEFSPCPQGFCNSCPAHHRCNIYGNGCVYLSQINQTCNPSLGPNVNGSNCEAPLICYENAQLLGTYGVCRLPRACTQEAKLCGDGTSVGRDPNNNCEFPPCPQANCTGDTKTCPDGTVVGRNSADQCNFLPCPQDLFAIANLGSTVQSLPVSGMVIFHQRVTRLGLGQTRVTAAVSGIDIHWELDGWHIHQFGNLSARQDGSCLSTGAEYPPNYMRENFGMSHFSPGGTETYDGWFTDVSLLGTNSVIGRGFAIHVGQGTAGLSGQPTVPIVCGVIGWAGDNSKAYDFLLRNNTLSNNSSTAKPKGLEAMVILEPSTTSGVSGKAIFTQNESESQTTISIRLSGLPSKNVSYLVGWHIHEFGNLTSTSTLNGRCDSTGGHYNPFNKTHGAPGAVNSHLGDLGNLPVNQDGTADFEASFNVSLIGRYSIVGRSLVIHAMQDDLGRNGNESLINGNAGMRISCGVIGWSIEPPKKALRLQ